MCIIEGPKMDAATNPVNRLFDAMFAPALASVEAWNRSKANARREYVRERWHEIEDGRMPENMLDADVDAFCAVLDRLDEAEDAMSTQP